MPFGSLATTEDSGKFASESALVFEGEAKLFDDGIGQDLARHALDFGFRLLAIQATVQNNLEIFTLTDILQPLVAQFVKGALNGFALGIQNAPF